MKFLCGSCRTKYQISDEKVRGKILTIRCKKCGEKVLVKESLSKNGQTVVAPLAKEVQAKKAKAISKSQSSAALSTAFDAAMDSDSDESPTRVSDSLGPPGEDDDGIEWFTAIDGVQNGPYSFGALLRRVRTGELIGRHYVWHDGFGPWLRIRDCDDLKGFLKEPPKRSVLPPPPIDSPIETGEVVDLAEKDRKRDAESPEEDRKKTEADRAQPESSVAAGSLRPASEGLGKNVLAVETFAAGESGDIDPDALFRSVPTAEGAQKGQKESTKFFVRAAGVNAQKSRGKFGLALGVAAVALLAVGFYGLSSGALSLGTTMESPFQKSADRDSSKTGNPGASRVLSSEEKAKLKRELTQKKRAVSVIDRARAVKKTNRIRPVNRSPDDNYIDNDDKENGAPTNRHGDSAMLSIQFPKGSKQLAKPMIAPVVPDTDLSQIEVPSTGRLDQAMIRQVVNARKSSMAICYQRELKANSKLGGKVEFVVTVEPNGTVSKSTVRTRKFRGSGLAQCFADKIKSWRFPEFSGQAQQVIVPFVLQQRNTY